MPQSKLQLDPVALISETRLNAVSAILLVERLSRTAPEDMSPEEKKAFKAMSAAGAVVERVREERATRQPARVKPVLVRFNVAWGGVSSVLAAGAALPVTVASAKVERMQKMRELLFPDAGVPTLNGDAETAYVDGHERLVRIEEREMKKELVALVGQEHYDALVLTTSDLGEVLGVGETARTVPSSTAMSEALREATHAIGNYGRKLLATLDDENEGSVRRFTDALGPLIDYKASISRSGGSTDAGADPAPTESTTAPTVPTAPATSA